MWLANQTTDIPEVLRLSQLGVMHFSNALAQDADMPTIHSYLGQCLMLSGNLTKAMEHLSIAVKQDPNDANAFYLMACIYKNSNFYQEAMTQAKAAIAAANRRGLFDRSDEAYADYHKLVEELRPMLDSRNSVLRFEVGDRVECKTNLGWRDGRIIKLHYQEERFDPNFIAPYQVILVDKCTCLGICSCEDRFIYAPADKDYCIRSLTSITPKATEIDFDLKYQFTSKLSFKTLPFHTLMHELAKVSCAIEWLWIGKNIPIYIHDFHQKYIQRRRIFPNDEANIHSYVSSISSFFAKDSTKQLLQRIRNDDSNGMIDLADCYYFNLRSNEFDVDLAFAKTLYSQAADKRHPEACTQLAIFNYLKMFKQRDFDVWNGVAPLPSSKYYSFDHKEMWKHLESAADQDYISPFMLNRVFDALKYKSWNLSKSFYSILDRFESALEAQVNVKNVCDNMFYCSNPLCTVSSNDMNDFKLCARCLSPTAKYCSKSCQKVHWPHHKQFCVSSASKGQASVGSGMTKKVVEATSTSPGDSSPSSTISLPTDLSSCMPSNSQKIPLCNTAQSTPSSSLPLTQPSAPSSSSSSSSSTRRHRKSHEITSSSSEAKSRSHERGIDNERTLSSEIMLVRSRLNDLESSSLVDTRIKFQEKVSISVPTSKAMSSNILKHFHTLMKENRDDFSIVRSMESNKRRIIRLSRRERFRSSYLPWLSMKALIDQSIYLADTTDDFLSFKYHELLNDEMFFSKPSFGNSAEDRKKYIITLSNIAMYSAKLSMRQKSLPQLLNVSNIIDYITKSGSFPREDYAENEEYLIQLKVTSDRAFEVYCSDHNKDPAFSALSIDCNNGGILTCKDFMSESIVVHGRCDNFCPICLFQWDNASISISMTHVGVFPCKHAMCVECLHYLHTFCQQYHRYMPSVTMEENFRCLVCDEPIPLDMVHLAADVVGANYGQELFAECTNYLCLHEDEGRAFIQNCIVAHHFKFIDIAKSILSIVGKVRRRSYTPRKANTVNKFPEGVEELSKSLQKRMSLDSIMPDVFDPLNETIEINMKIWLKGCNWSCRDRYDKASREPFTYLNDMIHIDLSTFGIQEIRDSMGTIILPLLKTLNQLLLIIVSSAVGKDGASYPGRYTNEIALEDQIEEIISLLKFSDRVEIRRENDEIYKNFLIVQLL